MADCEADGEVAASDDDWLVRPVTVWEVIKRGHNRPTDRVEHEDEAMRMARALAQQTCGRAVLLNRYGKVVSDG